MIRSAKRVAVIVAVAAAALAWRVEPARAVDPPKWVAAMHIEAQGAVGLRWLPVPGATAYKVLRSTTSGSGYQEIAAPVAPQHFDKGIAPGTYYYVLQAVAGAEASANSPEKMVSIVVKEAIKPNPPEWQKGVMDQGSKAILLQWKPIDGAMAYNIYRRESFKPAGKEDLVASVQSAEPYFDKANLKKGIEYVYTVSVLDSTFMESDKSVSKKVKFAPKVAKKVTKKEEVIVENHPVEPLGKITFHKTEGEKIRGQTNPAYTAWYDGELYVFWSIGRVQVFDADNMRFKRQFGKRGSGKGDFAGVMGQMVFDHDGNLNMIYKKGTKIIKYSTDGGYLGEISLTDGYDPELDKFRIAPNRFAFDKDGNIYLADSGNHLLRVYDPKGKALKRVGKFGFSLGEFSVPATVRILSDGRKVILDVANGRVQVLGADDKPIRTFGSTGTLVGQFASPAGLVVNEEKGWVYVSDFLSNVVHVWTLEGEVVGVIKYYDSDKEEGFVQASGITISDEGTMYLISYGDKTIYVFADAK